MAVSDHSWEYYVGNGNTQPTVSATLPPQESSPWLPLTFAWLLATLVIPGRERFLGGLEYPSWLWTVSNPCCERVHYVGNGNTQHPVATPVPPA